MAGGYGHLANGGGWSLIENMGDAYETVEELYYLVCAHVDAASIETALETFSAYANGTQEADDTSASAAAYRETQRAMNA